MEISENSTSDEDKDEVVFEADVFLSKSLAENLYLFHYPTRIADVQNVELNCLSARIKPKQQKVELEIGLDTHSDNYDRSKGEQIAYNVDGGSNPSENVYYKSSMMDKYVLSGTKACSSSKSYALGLLRSGELHITPVHSIIELRPGFTHMDKIDTHSKKAMNAEAKNEAEEEEEEAVAVTVRYEGPNAERERKMRQKSFQYFQKQNSTEPWVDVKYNKFGSNRSKVEYEKLTCHQMYKDVVNQSIPPQEYLKDLVPECLRLSGYQSVTTEETAILADKSLADQVRHLMINAHVMRFSVLMKKLPSNADPLNVERHIQHIAVLVQGCWAVKSDILYPEKTVSPYTGANSKLLVNARDYILLLFTKSEFLTRSKVLSAIYVPDEDFRSIITPIAVKSDRKWKFKFPFDTKFVESHPAIEQSQDIKWNLRYKRLVKDLGMSETEGDPTKLPNLVARPRKKRLSHNSLSEEGEDLDNPAPGCSRENKAKKTPPVPRKKSVPQSPTKSGPKSRPFQMATLDVSPTFLESTIPEGAREELRELVGDAIRERHCATAGELRELVAGSQLARLSERDDFGEVLEAALVAAGAQRLKNKWPQNTTPETLYAFYNYGNKLDRYRAALLDLFSATARTRTNLFIKKVEDELREIVSDADCRQVFEEYCVYKSGFYYLKGTIALDS